FRRMKMSQGRGEELAGGFCIGDATLHEERSEEGSLVTEHRAAAQCQGKSLDLVRGGSLRNPLHDNWRQCTPGGCGNPPSFGSAWTGEGARPHMFTALRLGPARPW